VIGIVGYAVLVLAANKSDLLDTIPSDHMAMKEKDRQRLQQLCENGAALFKQATAYAATIGASLFKTSAKSGAGMMKCMTISPNFLRHLLFFYLFIIIYIFYFNWGLQ
jgi:hypothetical protein